MGKAITTAPILIVKEGKSTVVPKGTKCTVVSFSDEEGQTTIKLKCKKLNVPSMAIATL